MYNIDDLNDIEEQIITLQEKRKEIISCIYEKNNKLNVENLYENADFLKEFACVDSLNITDNTVVAYQGVPGAYSHQAMFKFFGKGIKNINVPSFEDVIRVVKNGEADYGVLPIENSSAGFVNGIYDMVGNSGITVVGEDEVHVAHALMGVPGAKLSQIETVYSHPQGLMQCKHYLDKMKWKQCTVANTAVAAMQVVEEGDMTKAAIASELAAEIYGLDILEKNIVDNQNNTTRFVILSRDKIYEKKAKNIIISFSLPHESGTLYNILSHINLNGINMTSIESRPLTGRKWEYSFFVTMEGSLLDSKTIGALQGMYQDSIDFRIIGTY
jgi:chorismate mutase/prephenate dehydratase